MNPSELREAILDELKEYGKFGWEEQSADTILTAVIASMPELEPFSVDRTDKENYIHQDGELKALIKWRRLFQSAKSISKDRE